MRTESCVPVSDYLLVGTLYTYPGFGKKKNTKIVGLAQNSEGCVAKSLLTSTKFSTGTSTVLNLERRYIFFF